MKVESNCLLFINFFKAKDDGHAELTEEVGPFINRHCAKSNDVFHLLTTFPMKLTEQRAFFID